ncbi:MAG: hypothetical protein L6282_05710 [Candidatus Methanoperedenaceae archaeon]|nr:hypothetical protein [Candidatus Methanoperedenaceae archaeon]
MVNTFLLGGYKHIIKNMLCNGCIKHSYLKMDEMVAEKGEHDNARNDRGIR